MWRPWRLEWRGAASSLTQQNSTPPRAQSTAVRFGNVEKSRVGEESCRIACLSANELCNSAWIMYVAYMNSRLGVHLLSKPIYIMLLLTWGKTGVTVTVSPVFPPCMYFLWNIGASSPSSLLFFHVCLPTVHFLPCLYRSLSLSSISPLTPPLLLFLSLQTGSRVETWTQHDIAESRTLISSRNTAVINATTATPHASNEHVCIYICKKYTRICVCTSVYVV